MASRHLNNANMGLASLLSFLCLDDSTKSRKRRSSRYHSSTDDASYTTSEKSPPSKYSSPRYSSSSNKSTPERHVRYGHHHVRSKTRSSGSESGRRNASYGRNVSRSGNSRPRPSTQHRSGHPSSRHGNDRSIKTSTRKNAYQQAVDSSVDLLAGRLAGVHLDSPHSPHGHDHRGKGKNRSAASNNRGLFEPVMAEAVMPVEAADEGAVYYCEYCLERFTTPGLRKYVPHDFSVLLPSSVWLTHA